MRMQVFFSDKCPDCYSIVPLFRREYPNAEFYNITESMPNLKRFLHYRDQHPAFDDVRLDGFVGIPSVVLNGGQHVFWSLTQDELEEIKRLMTD